MATAETKSGFNTLAVVMVTVATLAFLGALTLFLQGGWLAARNLEYEAKVIAPGNPVVSDALVEQQAVLDQDYRWIDKDQGRVGVPIDRAIDLVVERGGRLTPGGTP